MTAVPKLIRIHFESPGLHTSIQDLGRAGLQSSGIPLGGVMDRSAAMSANHLVDNPVDAPVLEITLLGPKIHFQAPCQIAICGADLAPKLDGQPINNNETINIEQGNVLRFMRPLKGCRAYLAIGGKWLVQEWLGSASLSTVHWQQLTPQSKIEKNSILEIDPKDFIAKRRLNNDPLAALSEVTTIKVLPGPEFDNFERTIIAQFFSRVFQVTPASNRMGYRLEPAIEGFAWPFTSISSGIIPGTIQMTNGGQPIILLADAQTIGGYPRIANVTEESLDLLAQLRPGDNLRFQFVSIY